MLSSTWMDPVIGVDVHIVLVPAPPAPPIPTPMPMPFVGLVFDPAGFVIGAAMSQALSGSPGITLVYSLPATNCGTEVWNIPPHPPAPFPFARGKVPDDAELMLGSLQASMSGTLGVRFGEIALSCSDPIRLPTSVVMAIPKGPPVLAIRPPVPDVAMIAMGLALRAAFRILGAAVRAGARAFRALRAAQRNSEFFTRLSARLRGRSRTDPSRLRQMYERAVCFVTGHPVDVATGRMFTEAIDFSLPGPLPLVLERVYDSSMSHRAGPLGYGWTHSLDEALWFERGKAVYRAADGREIEFDLMDHPERTLHVGDRVYHPLARLWLRCTGVMRFEVETAAHVVHELGPVPGGAPHTARLLRRRTLDGHAIELSYDARGRLEWARDSGGRLVGFEHDARNRLTRVKLPLRRDRGWTTHRSYHYDERGDLVRVDDSLGHSFRYEYDGHLMVQETDRAGLSFYFQYDAHGAEGKCIRTWGDGGIYDHAITYDVRNRKTIVEDSLGAITVYEMDEAGQVVSILDPVGGTTTYAYSEDDGLPILEVDALGHAIRKEYDARGNLVRVIDEDGAETVIEHHDVLNVPVRVVGALGAEWRFEYDAAGHVVERRLPTGASTRYGWVEGLLSTIVDPEGRTVAFEHDEAKNLERISLPNGAELVYRTDGRGTVYETRDARGSTAEQSVDSEGRVLALRSMLGLERRMAYDAEGNLLESQGSNRHVRLRYGHFHRVVAREEAGTELGFEYDTEGRLTGVVNEVGERYAFELDAAGRVRAETGFDGNRRAYLRDQGGRVTKTVLPSGRSTEIVYDPAGRVRRVAHDDGAFTELAYDGAGRLIEAKNEATTVLLERDALGQVTAESQDAGATWVRSTYGPAAHRSLVESDLGARQAVERDSLGAVTALVHGAEVDRSAILGFERDALGLEIAREMLGGVRVEWSRDAAGRPTERRTARRRVRAGAAHRPTWPTVGASDDTSALDPLDARSYQWRGEDQIAAIVDAAAGPRFYDHDARGRLVRERRPAEARAIERAMDAVGNVYRSEDRRDRRYGRGGCLEEADGVRYEHDPDGNQTKKLEPDGREWRYRWNGHGMLAEVVRPDGERVRFEYDAFARRTKKALVTVSEDGTETVERETRFVWDGHTVLHELDAERGPTTWYWEPGTFTPVLKERAGRCWSVASDHLGTPTEMYDELGELAWKMQLDAFGVPSFDEGTAEDCPWRWPGQYDDAETGSYYNWWRHYDPRHGRYESLDPIGLMGGFALRGYPFDPLRAFDAYGLIAGVDDPRVGVQSHLARFAGGSSVFVPESVLTTVVPRFGQLGRPDGLYVTTPEAADELERAAGGDRAELKRRLAIPDGSWNEPIYRVDIPGGEQKGLRMPSGFESGANEFFRWGGYTSGGMPEAVIDPVPAAAIKGRCVAT